MKGKIRSNSHHKKSGWSLPPSSALVKDKRVEMAEELEPFAFFNISLQRFQCRGCNWLGETFRGLKAHLEECEDTKSA